MKVYVGNINGVRFFVLAVNMDDAWYKAMKVCGTTQGLTVYKSNELEVRHEVPE